MSETKERYMAEDRTFCDHCGNSDVEMNEIHDELCYYCLHPEEHVAHVARFHAEHAYVFGEPECPW